MYTSGVVTVTVRPSPDTLSTVWTYRHTHSIQAGTHTHSIQAGTHTHSIQAGTHTHSIQAGTHTHSIQAGTHTHSIQAGTHTGRGLYLSLIPITCGRSYHNTVTGRPIHWLLWATVGRK